MKFGTSGLRGLVSEMTDTVCEAHAAAFVDHLRRSGARSDQILLGRDLRPSSPRIAAACARAVAQRGVQAVDCGVVPTPALALEAIHRGVAAIMVTGSHIPFDRNGLKFYLADGEITKADEAGIISALAASRPRGRGAGAIPAADGAAEVTARYVARYCDFFGSDCLAGLRLGAYQHSAAGRDLLSGLLRRLGADVLDLGRTDSFVPVDTEAVAPDDAERFRKWVIGHRLDALVSTDGDGDRPLVVDETGAMLRGDALGAITARLLGADAVATPLSSSSAVERSGWFAEVRRTRIGSPYVIEAIEALRREGAALPVGYEANGGFLLGGDAVAAAGQVLAALPTRDAMAPIMAVLAASAARGCSLSALMAELPGRVTVSDRVPDVPASVSGHLIATLSDDATARSGLLDGIAAPPAAIDTLDGVRMTLASGDIVHLRASGNAPELRCYCEAASGQEAERLLRDVTGRVEALLGRAEQTGPAPH
jgi:phosphomannomutase